MEIGHNILHGQWDWMNDPDIHSRSGTGTPPRRPRPWKHSHNYVHHTYTNILGKDRISATRSCGSTRNQTSGTRSSWLQPLSTTCSWLTLLFEWGVAVHDLDFGAIRTGEKPMAEVREDLKGITRQGARADRQGLPRLAGGQRRRVRAGSAGAARPPRPAVAVPASGVGFASFRATAGSAPPRTRSIGCCPVSRARSADRSRPTPLANLIRNVWALRDHLLRPLPRPDVHLQPEEVENETRGGWYVRQLIGAANIEGSPLFHVDQRQPRLPGRAPPVSGHAEQPVLGDRAAGQGHLRALRTALQLGTVRQTARFMVHRTIFRLAFPGGKPRPKPGPYRGEEG